MALRHSSCRQQLIVEEERAACVAMGRWEGRAAKAAARLAGVGRAAAISSNEPHLQYMETVAEVRESKSIKARDPECKRQRVYHSHLHLSQFVHHGNGCCCVQACTVQNTQASSSSGNEHAAQGSK